MKKEMQNWQLWILQNVVLLNNRYGRENVIFSSNNWHSILIKNYALPSNWKQLRTKLLIMLPSKVKLFYDAPERFYIEKGLSAVNGIKPGHYFEDKGFNDLSQYNLARFSFHINEGWNPHLISVQGTNLLHVLDGLQQGMSSAAREVLHE